MSQLNLLIYYQNNSTFEFMNSFSYGVCYYKNIPQLRIFTQFAGI
jgi:hypothetical protein